MALYQRFKKVREEVESQMKAIKENSQAFDDKTIDRFETLNDLKNDVESNVKSFNKEQNEDDRKAALESLSEFFKEYTS